MIKTENSKSISTAVIEDIVIQLSSISKKYNLYKNKQDRLKEALHPRRKKYHREFYALREINLEVKKGEVLGIVGKNGSGKSTLLKVISGILTPSAGKVEVRGKVVALLELGAGFNPQFTGLENIYFYCSLLGYTREQIDEIKDEIIAFAELDDFIHQPIKTYSSGMRARLAFAVSINVDPDILILDEVLAVGDELFRRKCYARMEEFFKGGKTILFVSHSLEAVNQLCTRAILLDRGEYILEGPAKMVTMYYQKYLFAKSENISAVRKEIIKMNQNDGLKKQIVEQFEKDEGFKSAPDDFYHPSNGVKKQGDKTIHVRRINYVEELKPKSTVAYKTHDVDIFDVELRTLDNVKVNILKFNYWYYVCYQTRFNLNVDNVSFAMSIMNNTGTNISSAGGLQYRISEKVDAVKDDLFLVKWKFKNIMSPGIYYVSVQVSGDIDGRHEILSRIHDATAFKINNHKDQRFHGLVSLEQSVFFEKGEV